MKSNLDLYQKSSAFKHETAFCEKLDQDNTELKMKAADHSQKIQQLQENTSQSIAALNQDVTKQLSDASSKFVTRDEHAELKQTLDDNYIDQNDLNKYNLDLRSYYDEVLAQMKTQLDDLSKQVTIVYSKLNTPIQLEDVRAADGNFVIAKKPQSKTPLFSNSDLLKVQKKR